MIDRIIRYSRWRPTVPVGVLILWGVVTVLALAGGWYLMFYLSWALLFLAGAAYVLAFAGLRSLYFDRQARALRAEVGSYFDERVVIENQSWIPKLWLEIEDQGQHPEHTASFVVSLGPYGRFVRPVHTLCRQRGVFQLGPVFAESGDPFGLFRQRRQISGHSTLVVYPIALDLPSFGKLPGAVPGGGLQGERVQFTTPNVAGVREYQPGDTFNRIHWASTARQQRLMVKEFELDPYSDVWLVLDLDRRTMAGEGTESTEEYAVTICASLAKRFLNENRAVGIITQGQVLSSDRGIRQLLRSLEMLAYVRPRSDAPLEELLLSDEQRFGRTDSLVVITSSSDDRWVRAARGLAARGIRASAVLLEASTFGPAPGSLVVAAQAAASGIPTYLIKRGESIEQGLATPTFGMQGA
ncbi:MAG: DUF58 domain-containing protein [Chloroflexota bacterium]